jgi:hypothetical protein
MSDVGCFSLIHRRCPHLNSSQLHVTFGPIRQKDRAIGGDEESEEGDFYDVSPVSRCLAT